MGIRGRFILVTALIAFSVGLASYVMLEKSNSELLEMSAVRIADIVSAQVVADRAEYTANVVGKLKSDGLGASREAGAQTGFVQLPAQFVRNVSKRVAAVAGDLYSYALVSEWNLNEDQGLASEFDQWAWGQLAEQNDAFVQSGVTPGSGGYSWKPVYRFESQNGAPVLSYMRADPAAAESCVSCHNQYEEQAEIIAMRNSAGVSPGKQWKLHELMGAIRVNVPVNEVAVAAQQARNSLLAGLAAVFTTGFLLLFGLIQQTVIKPVVASVREVEGFADNVDSVVGCNQSLVISADTQQQACNSALSSLESGVDDGRDMAASLRALAETANENAKSAVDSAVHCNELDESFTSLKGRLQRMLRG